jgi:hypothetical protein
VVTRHARPESGQRRAVGEGEPLASWKGLWPGMMRFSPGTVRRLLVPVWRHTKYSNQPRASMLDRESSDGGKEPIMSRSVLTLPILDASEQ